MQDRARALRRAQRAFSIATDPGATAGEAQAAEALLRRLSMKWGFIEADYADAFVGGAEHVAAEAVEERIALPSTAYWRYWLGLRLAEYCHVKVITFKGSKWLRVMGLAADNATFRELYASLVAQVDRDAKLYLRDLPRWYTQGERRSLADQYRKGWTRGLRQRLDAMRAAAAPKTRRLEGSECTSLVLVGRNDAAATLYQERYGTKKGGTYRDRSYSHAAQSAGQAAGRRARVHRELGE